MKKLLLITLLCLPLSVSAFEDHRGFNLDSLELVVSHWTSETLSKATAQQRKEYCIACRDLAWGYLQVDAPRSVYYARRAIQTGQLDSDQRTIFDASILIGQYFWARERYDSARVYYLQASDALAVLEADWTRPDRSDLESYQARLWGTLGNFYAAQDSLEQFAYYYGKAGELFEKWEWWEDCSTLYRNIGEVYLEDGDLKTARPAYEKGLELARQSGDSLILANALYGMGRWYKESGRTAKALKYLTQADEYYGNHAREEAYNRAETLAVMKDAYDQLYRNTRIIAIGAVLLLLLAGGFFIISRRLKRTRKELSETAAILDETIEELRPAEDAPQGEEIHLTAREKDIVRLLRAGKTTPEIAEELFLSEKTILWYRKRLHAKLDVHTAAALTAEVIRRNLL